jgi:hypothetical protein
MAQSYPELFPVVAARHSIFNLAKQIDDRMLDSQGAMIRRVKKMKKNYLDSFVVRRVGLCKSPFITSPEKLPLSPCLRCERWILKVATDADNRKRLF